MGVGYYKKLKKRHILKRLVTERFSEPLHMNIVAFFVWIFGSYKAKIWFDLVLRQNHAYSLLQAAEHAIANGIKKITVIEFGVATGGGLMNIGKICQKLSKIYQVEFQVFGFDTGEGMPEPMDYRDHPELYKKGDFKMNRLLLESRLPANCQLVIGKVKDTIPHFLQHTDLINAPIGFISFDLDYYYSTKEALSILQHHPESYLSRFPVYFDDIALWSHNSWGGELLAIEEFNQTHPMRKIEQNRFLFYNRIFKHAAWLEQIYFVHVLDAPVRNRIRVNEPADVLVNPYL